MPQDTNQNNPELSQIILLHEKFLQFDWLRPVVYKPFCGVQTFYTVGYAVFMNQRQLHIGLAATNSVQNYFA